MSDDDLIRRGDALDAMLTGPRTVQERIDLIRALPAVQPAPVTVEEAARVLLDNPDAVLELAVQIVRHNKSVNGNRPGIHPSLTAALRALAGEQTNE
jgi:hypothetical protein